MARLFSVTPGVAAVTTDVSGTRVRVEGMGVVLGLLAPDTVLLTRGDGATIVVQQKRG